VDHNEAAQSVPGLEEAEILEIIDHHRLADIQTTNPIYVRNEPVGSTNTIIASMFQDRGLMPSTKMAGMMAAAILSDTVMFKSPTCTERDRRTAERMARIANVSLDELGRDIFSASMDSRTTKDLLFSDYKEFHIAGHDLAVAQITCVDSPKMLERKEEFLTLMRNIAAEKGYTMVEDAGRGYRQVVPSPKPIDVIEKEMVNTLVDAGHVVITVGGGGIPVIRKDGKLVGTPAVIDKDFASAKLAELVKADKLVILTAVDRVCIHFGKPEQKALEVMTVAEAEQYCAEGHFAPGSMLPKVQAAMGFAKAGGEAIIASLEKAADALAGKSGTRVIA